MMLSSMLLSMINNIFLISKSLFFWLSLVLSVLLFGPVTFIFGLFSYDLCLRFSKLWCRYTLFFLKTFCALSFKINGPELNSTQLVVSRHQSAWETIFFAAYVDKPIFILKKELLRIPFFGWCLYLLKNISIDRSDGVNSLKKIMKACDSHIIDRRTLIIFPEGTRAPHGEKVKIKKGIFKIMESLKISSLLVNHDAGKYWNKNSFLIRPGVIDIQTLTMKYNENISELHSTIIDHFN
mgnify:CR=1 FL=1